jgi:hypothetical protein
VPLAGIEPTLSVPETDVLSVELQRHAVGLFYQEKLIQYTVYGRTTG